MPIEDDPQSEEKSLPLFQSTMRQILGPHSLDK